MNEDYLWDKTGTDAGIEKLEYTLHAFSYKPMPPPELPAKVITLAEKPRRSFFRLGFAMAFAAAVVVVFSTVWFLIPNRNAVVETGSVQVAELRRDTFVLPVDPQPTTVNIVPEQNAPHAIRAVQTRVLPTRRRLQTTALKVREDHPEVEFTDEEKYAYSQLMLALSITGSKLKIVRDTIAGTEDIKPSIERSRNLYQK